MFDYSEQIDAFRDKKVRLPKGFKDKLFAHRNSNRDRLISRLPTRINGLTISTSCFKPQGSSAVKTIIQTKFAEEQYDIDDGLVLKKADLVDEDGKELTSLEVKEHVLEALKDQRFVKQPNMAANAVRVYYKENDEERHHIDFPVYRKYLSEDGEIVRELAAEFGWTISDPTQVNHWFNNEVETRNLLISGKGTQIRQLIQLLKRFCRSRRSWDMPNGMKLTMLVAECQPAYSERIDVAFRELLEALQLRLGNDKVILNLAHPEKPEISRTENDDNVVELLEKIDDALKRLETLDLPEKDDRVSARSVWDWIFKTDGFFKEHDDESDIEAKTNRLKSVAALVNSGSAKTAACGAIGTTGVPNLPHRFYGESF